MPVSPKNRIAPDGGPVSNAHHTLKGWKLTPQKTVILKNSGKMVKISSVDYDPKYHELPGDLKERVSLEEKKKEPEPFQFSTVSKDDMLKMSFEGLRKLPEYGLLDDAPKTKEKLVSVLLEVRAGGLKKQAITKK